MTIVKYFMIKSPQKNVAEQAGVIMDMIHHSDGDVKSEKLLTDIGMRDRPWSTDHWGWSGVAKVLRILRHGVSN